MLEQLLSVHLLVQVRQAVGPLVQIRLVNLEYVSGEHHLGAFARPGYDGLYLVRGEILRLVADEEHTPQTPAPDVGQRGDHQFLLLQHGLYPQGFLAGRTELCLDDVQVVHQRLYERTHLGLLVSRDEADVLITKHYRRSCKDDLVEVLGLLYGCGQRQQGLSGSRSACHRD